jgi:large subunit ribosomal protein L3
MVNGLIGRKIGMTQVFGENKKVTPVTVIQVEPCVVVQKKTNDKDNYESVQLGTVALKPNKVKKPIAGHFKKHQIAPLKYLNEFEADDHENIKEGDVIKVDIFKVGDKVDVSGVSKGKGFAGVVKRWGFKGGKASHGSRFHRLPGAIGACADPARTFKGKKMPGQMGNKNVTVQNLSVVDVKPEKNLILLKGAIPGSKYSIIYKKSS